MAGTALKDWTRTPLTERLGIRYPIIQGPLGGLSTQRLTAAVSNFGGLGSFGGHSLAPDAIRKAIREIRTLTSNPFAINLWVAMEEEGAFTSGRADFERSLDQVKEHIVAVGGTVPGFTPYQPLRFEEQVQVLLEEKVPVASFIFGIPSEAILEQLRRLGILVIGTATTVEEGIALDGKVDVIAASGFEGGGHRGSFLRPAEESLIGTISLVPQMVDAVNAPVVAAGGIADARGVRAAFALGAAGVQMGTVFLASDDSGASASHRKALRSNAARTTGLTRGFTGRLARGIRNQLLEEMNRPGVPILPYPLQRFLLRSLVSPADKAGRTEFLQLWAGQSAALARHEDAVAFLTELVAELDARA